MSKEHNYYLSFENVSKNFDLRLLYKDINFKLYPSDIVLLTGKNGSGKSTLLKMAAGLLSPSKGKIHCTLAKEHCAYLGHYTFLYPQLTAYENLEFWAKASLLNTNSKELNQKIMEALNLVHLHKFAHDFVHIFSRGMAQRLNLARIILQEAELLLLDEPSTGLDFQSKEIFYQCIADFRARNACILWVSHDIEADKVHANKFIQIENKNVEFFEGEK